jgi:hypothetical protein
MNYKIAKTLGLNTDQKASQVIYSVCDEENVFLAVLTIESDDAFVFGRQLLSDLVDSYCEKDQVVGEKLTATFEEAKKTLEGKQFNLLLAAVSGKVLYLIGKGSVLVTLKRAETISPLLSEGSEQLISGFLQGRDKVFLSTQALSQFLGSNLQNSLKLPLEEWEDEMSVRLNEEGVESGSFAGLLLEIEDPVVEAAEIVASSPMPEEEQITSLNSEEASNAKSSPIPIVLGHLKALTAKAIDNLPKSGRIRLIAALAIILVILIGVGINFFGARGEQKEKEITSLLEQAKSAKSEAEGLKTLNASEADRKLQEAFVLVDQALKIDSNSTAAKQLKSELEAIKESVSQKYSESTSEVTDLKETKDGFRGSRLSLLANSLAILDSNGQSLINLNLATKKAEVLAEKADLGKAADLVLDEDLIFVYSTDKGIVKIDLGNNKTTSAVEVDDDWGLIRGISVFGGNIYLLDSEKDQIWKYLPTTSGFSNKREYLTSGTKVDLGDAISIQIDSSIYVLKQNGDIFKFTKGTQDDFSISGLDKPLKEPKALFTSPQADNLYILDSGNNRVVVLGKSGEYKAQYQADKLGVASGLVVNEKDKKIYLIDGSKVYTMDLK